MQKLGRIHHRVGDEPLALSVAVAAIDTDRYVATWLYR